MIATINLGSDIDKNGVSKIIDALEDNGVELKTNFYNGEISVQGVE